ncbi:MULTISPECIES: chaplin [unclassified Streptomyces]|uniref:chaplin n=1 Tax=unclassified Streptomyces TaxID=2593676 RepID=UPI002366DBDD|nr:MULTISPECIES: chaplin [unclassified Streptomyces]MDF3141730.1 chaplin [Streptomyces sp. T21Q-yed]WDF44180.1 chaplin [Streptomyces sp. T12]
MRRVTRNGVIAFAATGAMAVTMPAYADSAADGAAADSPGLISGNTIQLPVHVPVNVCGNTVNVVGLLNPAVGNTCTNAGGGKAGAASKGGASAEGSGKDSPGVVSGNTIQLPVHLPVNVSGNTVNVVGVGNPATGNESVNTPGNHPPRTTKPTPKPSVPPARHQPRPVPPAFVPHGPEGALAHTGADQTLAAVAGGTLLVLSGAVLYRRFRPLAVR